ncbi:hypothetical protein CAPTEDRAFT_85761, partial [Capitella teleta]
IIAIFPCRFLATGETFTSLSFGFRIGVSTISAIVSETVDSIWKNLGPRYLAFPKDATEWESIAERYEERWNFPHCVGALDGKHVTIMAPPNAGSAFFNYKKSHSIVLLALVDADCRFIAIEVGAFGRSSDGGIFANSNLGEGMLNNSINLPKDGPLPNADHLGQMPYTIVADDAFPLKCNIMKPYPGKNQ